MKGEQRIVRVVAAAATLLLIASYVAGCRQTPLPPELARRWHLVDVIINGEAEPPLAEDFWASAEYFWIDIEADGTITYSDGCNRVTHRLTVTRFGRFTIGGMVATTLSACGVFDPETGEFEEVLSVAGPNHVRFLEALDSVVRYEIHAGRLWLYYPKPRSNALVFR